MLRKIISIVIIIVALIALFFLVRTAINAFTGDSEPSAPTKTEATVTEPVDTDGDRRADSERTTTTETTTRDLPGNENAPATGTTNGQQLANAGPAETAVITIATVAALGTVLFVRRRMIANL